jgi:hemin uptake protein HemP
MQFEHLIEINDPLNPLIDALTRQQLWQGLVLRAESPQLFMPHLDECILQPGDIYLERRLRFGKLIVVDQVTFEPQEKVVFDVAEQDEIKQSRLCMSIEEPAPERLYVRFQYTDSQSVSEDAVNAMYDDFRRSAYKEADIDTIRIIRELAALGRLNLC